MGDNFCFVDYDAPPGVETYGEKPSEVAGRSYCPKCGALAEMGYGFGCGAGIGTYWYCETDGCDWFYKVLDKGE